MESPKSALTSHTFDNRACTVALVRRVGVSSRIVKVVKARQTRGLIRADLLWRNDHDVQGLLPYC